MKDNPNNRTQRVTFRVTEKEYERLRELAYGSYRLISTYCRDCVFNKNIVVIPGFDELTGQLRRIGNNLNQLVSRVNAGDFEAVYLGEVCKEMNNIWTRLDELTRKGEQ